MLVVRDVGGKARIEFPIGKVLYETTGHVSYARLSPKGDRIAFLDHPFPLDDAGTVAVIDLAGKKTTLTGKWASEHGLAWAPSGDEIWFTATEAGANRSLYAVTLVGQAARRDARARRPEAPRHRAKRPRPADAREPARRDPRHPAGRRARARHVLARLLLRRGPLRRRARRCSSTRKGRRAAPNYTVYLRKSDHSPVVRLGEGNALSLSPDGKWALSILPIPNSPFLLLPTGTGEHQAARARRASAPEQAATWLPDSKSILFAGERAGPRRAALRAERSTGASPARSRPRESRRRSRDSPSLPTASSSPRSVRTARRMLFPVDGGVAAPDCRDSIDGEYPLRFSPDGRSLYVWKRGDVPARVYRVDLETGRREVWKELLPADPAGVERISNVLVTPDGKGYAYCYARLLSDLFVVEGLR